MNSLLIIVPVAAGAFVATNMDNLILLVSLLARYRRNRVHVIVAYLACALTIALMGFWLAAAADLAPVKYLGLLGIVPLTLGIVGVFRLFRRNARATDVKEEPIGSMQSAFVATFVVQLSNGSDTVVTFAALFADSLPLANMLIILTLAMMAAIFVLVAILAMRHPVLSQWIEKYGSRVTPFILIIVGTFILLDTANDVMPG